MRFVCLMSSEGGGGEREREGERAEGKKEGGEREYRMVHWKLLMQPTS